MSLRLIRALAVAAPLAASALAGCSTTQSAGGPAARADDPETTLRQSRIEIHQRGGIAALHMAASVDGEGPRYALVSGRLCDAPVPCQPTDSASGAVSAAAARALFDVVDGQGFFALREDYGRCVNCADVMSVEVTVRHAGRTKTVRAEGTAPPALDSIVATLWSTVRTARGR